MWNSHNNQRNVKTFNRLFSCTSVQKENLSAELVHAESLMYAHPDSALAILESMPMPPATDKLQNATWCLLLIQARDKNYVRHTSDSMIHIAHDYFMKQEDAYRKALALNYEGRVNEDLGEVAEQSSDMNDLSRAYGELAAVYREMGEYDSAFVYLRKDEALVVLNRQNRMHQIYLGLGSLFAHTAVYDSAIYYLNKSLAAHRLQTKRSAYNTLSAVYEKLGKADEALYSMKCFLNVQDSIQQQGERKAIAEIQARYNHEKMKSANMRLELEKSRTIRTALCLLLILMGAVAYILYVYQCKLMRKERMIQEKKELLEYNTLQLHKAESEISVNENYIDFLSDELKQSLDRVGEKNAEIEDLCEKNRQLAEESAKLQKSIKELTPSQELSELQQAYQNLYKEHEKLSKYEQLLYKKLLEQIPGLNQLRKNPKFITEEQWIDIKGWGELLSEDFAGRLSKQIRNIKENDIRLCYLIKLGFSNTAIATLEGVAASTITKRKQRMKVPMPEDQKEPLGKNHSFDEWIKRL